jgi:hypothetical protein
MSAESPAPTAKEMMRKHVQVDVVDEQSLRIDDIRRMKIQNVECKPVGKRTSNQSAHRDKKNFSKVGNSCIAEFEIDGQTDHEINAKNYACVNENGYQINLN